MNELIEIHFNKAGNTVIGNYSTYMALDKAITAKNVFVPFGYGIKSDEQSIKRLTEIVALFGHCIKTHAAFSNACKLSDVDLAPLDSKQSIV